MRVKSGYRRNSASRIDKHRKEKKKCDLPPVDAHKNKVTTAQPCPPRNSVRQNLANEPIDGGREFVGNLGLVGCSWNDFPDGSK